MVRMTSKVRSVLSATAAAALLASCGGGEGGNPAAPGGGGATPPPANSVRTVLLSGVPFVLNPETALFANVDNLPAGTLDVTVNWPGGGNLNLYVTENSCANFADVLAARCAVMAKSDGTTKPEVVRFSTTSGRTHPPRADPSQRLRLRRIRGTPPACPGYRPQHLKELKVAGLVKGDVEGPRQCYCLNASAVEDLAATLEEFLAELRTSCTDATC